MRIVATDQCAPGATLARSIYNERGNKLVTEGATLTSSMLARLKLLGISYLYVRDAYSDDIELVEPIPLEIRLEAMQVVESAFLDAQRKSEQGFGPFSTHIKTSGLQSVFKNLLAAIKDNCQTISLLSEIFHKNSYTFSHSVNVAIYTIAVSLKLGYDDQQLQEIGLGALLHDIGKMQIPNQILDKSEKLTDDEYSVIQLHPQYGFDLLKELFEISYSSAHCAFQHHERWDGSGYPRRLKGDEIHPYARLIAVCDVFDAMTSHRVYRKAMLPNEAMNWICSHSSALFEERSVDAFQKTISPYPPGLTVRLNTGETAIVVATRPEALDRPLVRVMKEPNGEMLTRGRELDLSQYTELKIVESQSLL